ncbi:hypothetical protein FQN60_014762 [Etheostoma spectabile]|uniref:Sodium/calcium exchanger membrane region domain-containing protein n=1 Tax=Etheostoma spectabile TaxID=54343 RepID=A0A5J5CQ22_9PERO|nr:hypothetical protein FQN60_014762 [Etheostoma spectabile]
MTSYTRYSRNDGEVFEELQDSGGADERSLQPVTLRQSSGWEKVQREEGTVLRGKPAENTRALQRLKVPLVFLLCSYSVSSYGTLQNSELRLYYESQLLTHHKENEEQLKEQKEEEEALTGKDEEEQRIADMGRPMLGDHVKLEIIIEESYEFKNTVDKLIKKTNLALLVGTNSWRDQFIEAITVSAAAQARMMTTRSAGKRSCRHVSTTLCTSSPSSGRLFSPLSRPQSTGTAGPASSSPSA